MLHKITADGFSLPRVKLPFSMSNMKLHESRILNNNTNTVKPDPSLTGNFHIEVRSIEGVDNP